MITETKVTVKRISLGGISFTAETGNLIRHKTYEMKLTAASPQSETDLCFKISIIEITELGAGKCECRALYRHLTDEQLLRINEIIDYYATDIKLKLADINAIVAG